MPHTVGNKTISIKIVFCFQCMCVSFLSRLKVIEATQLKLIYNKNNNNNNGNIQIP